MSIYFLSFHFTLPLAVDFSEVSDFLSKSEIRFAVCTSYPHQYLSNSVETLG